MKRRALALCAGLLLLGLLPGATLASATPTYLDQSNTTISHNPNTTGELAQTFTAGQSGPLSSVDLCLASMNNPVGGSLSVSIYPTNGAGTPVTSGTALATSGSASVPYSPDAFVWTTFSFGSPYVVTAGTMYAIVFNAGGSASIWATGNTDIDAYTRGAAWNHSGSSWASGMQLIDFDFRTYLQESVTTTVAWDKSQVTAGTGTALKLTVTMAFGNGAEAANYLVLLGNLPSWYVNPTSPTIVCSWGPCTLAAIQGVSGITVPASNPGAALTVTLQGTAMPVVSDEGTPGTVHGNGCIVVSVTSLCTDASASVTVAPAPALTPTPTPVPTPTRTPTPTAVVEGAPAAPTIATTPPPTSTSVGSGSDNTGGTIWFPSFALAVFFGGPLLLIEQRRRRTS